MERLVLLLHERQLPRHSVSSSLQGLHKAGLTSLHNTGVLCCALRSAILESLVKLLQVSFLVVCQFLFQRLDDLIFVSDNTVKLLELNALLMTYESTLHAAGSHTAGTEIQNASLPQLVVQSAGEGAPFLDGQLHLQTPPDMRDVLKARCSWS